MSYRLFYTRTAASEIAKLDKIVKKKIKRKVEFYAISPLLYAKKFISSSIGMYRWRVGDYRIIFDLHGKEIVILRVAHRREIYR